MNNLNKKIGFKKNLDKLLFLFATLYLMFVAAWFWKHKQQEISSLPITNNSTQKSSNNYPQNQDIKNISPPQDNLPQINIQTTKLPSPPLPIPSLTIPPLPDSNIASNIIPPPPSPLPLPSPPTLHEISPTPIPQPPKPIQSSSPSPSPPSISIPPPPPLPSPPKLTKVPVLNTLDKTKKNNLPNLTSTTTDIKKETNYNYTLIGIVELGDTGSMALFNINNVTEKVAIGGEIGTTGWVLMTVNGTQAVISRQNQSVYLRVGETF